MVLTVRYTPGLKLDATSISNFAKAKDAGGDVPGLPNIPPEKVSTFSYITEPS